MASASASVSIPRISLTRPASFTPVQFTPVYGQHLTPDVNILANSLKNFEERQYTAAEQMSKVNTSIAKIKELVHNDAETQQWVNNLSNETVGKLQQFIDEGNYGRAIFDSINTASSLLIRPDVTGRINSNKEYTEALNRVKEMADKGLISQDIADQWIEENPYYYYDIFDGESEDEARTNRENGYNYEDDPSRKIVGGSKWTPINGNPVRTVDINALMDSAIKQVVDNAEMSTSSTIYYKTKDGKYTTNPNEADKDNPYPWYQTDNGMKQVTKQQLKEAMRVAINSTPGAKASIEQDLSNGLWKTGKQFKKVNGAFVDANGNFVDNEFTDDNGLALDVNTYIDSLIDPKARIMAKRVVHNKTTFGLGAEFDSKLRLEGKKGKGKTGSGTSSALYDNSVPVTPVSSVNKRMAIDGLFSAQGKMNEAAASIADLATEAGIKYDRNTSIEEIWNRIPVMLKTPEAQEIYDSYVFTKSLIDNNVQFNENADAKDIVDAMSFMSSYDKGYAINENNSYYGDYMSRINNLFTDNETNKTVDEIYIPMIWDDYDFSPNLKPELEKEFGDAISFDETGKYIVVNRSNRLVLPKIIEKVEGYEGKSTSSGYVNYPFGTKGPFGETQVRNKISHTLRFDTQYKGEDGKLHPFNRVALMGGTFGNNYEDYFTGLYQKAKDRVDKLKDGEDNSLRYAVDPDNKYIRDYASIKTQFVPFINFGTSAVANAGADKQEMDAIIESWVNAMKAYNPVDDRLFIGSGGNDAIEITDANDRRILWSILGSDKYYTENSVYGYDPLTYDPKIHVGTTFSMSEEVRNRVSDIVKKYLEDTVSADKVKDVFSIDQPLDIILPDVDNNDAIKKLAKSDPMYIGRERLTNYTATNMVRVPITNNVILDTQYNAISVSGGSLIPLVPVQVTQNGATDFDPDGGVKILLGYQDYIKAYQESFAKGENTEKQFKDKMNELVTTILGKDEDNADVKSIVSQIIRDTKSHYNIQ